MKSFRPYYIALFILSAAIFFYISSVSGEENKAPRIDVVGNSLYIDGDKFFVKGVGYSPFRPGIYPGGPVSLDIIEADFKRIKEAGFNTIRVWGTMPEDQLTLADKYGLKVIQAAGIKPNADFGYEGFLRQAESQARQMAKAGKKHPNVIMYLVTNEPHSQAIVSSGVDKTIDMYKKLIGIIKQEDPYRPVSMANAYWTMWLDQSMWDIICFNAYNYCPALIEDITYANFINNLRELHAADKPFLVTEFGLSVSPEGPGKKGYGGNTKEDQAEGIIEDLRGLIQGGAIGGCVFEWNDEWWKGGNAAVHDGHPEEWFGIVGVETRENPQGTPRKAYYALKEELKMLVVRPVEGYRMFDGADIEVNTTQEIKSVRYKIDEGEWSDLTRHLEWWRGTIAGESLSAGIHTLTIQGMSGNNSETTRKINIIKCAGKQDISPAVNIELTTDKPSYTNGDIIKVKARLTDRAGLPLENHTLKMGIFNSANNYSRSWQGKTNERGFFTGSIPVVGRHKEWYYVYWSNADSDDYGYKVKQSKIGYVKAEGGKGFPLKWFAAKKAENITIDGIVDEEWLDAEKISIDADNNFIEGEVKNNADLSAEAQVLWDEGNLYLLVRVKDSMVMAGGYEKWDLWKGDSIELFISVDPSDIQENGYTSSDFQILIGSNGRMWISNQAKGGVRNSAPVLSYAVVKKDEAGYVLEAKISVSNFWDKPFRTFKSGEVLGFDIAVGDADETGMRKAKLVWNGTEDGYKDSAVWGRLKLE